MAAKDRDAYNAYMREYMARRFREKYRKWIAILGGCCALCGSTEELQIDHKDARTKSFDIGKNWSKSETKTLEELKKCQALCRSCHAHKSILDRGDTPARGTHGTLSSYRYCKCSECRAANAAWTREYKRSRRGRVA